MSADDVVFFTLIAQHRDPAGASRALRLAEAAVLRRAAVALNALPQDYECGPGWADAAERLRRTADEIEEKASSASAAPEVTPALHAVILAAVSAFQIDRHLPGGYDQQLAAHVTAAVAPLMQAGGEGQ